MRMLQATLVAGLLALTSISAQARSLLDGDYQLVFWQVGSQMRQETAPHPVTLTITGNQINGFAGCNRFTGQIQTFQGLHISAQATTRIACSPPAVANKERDVLNLLGRSTQFRFDPRGYLVFSTADDDQLVLMRQETPSVPANEAPPVASQRLH